MCNGGLLSRLVCGKFNQLVNIDCLLFTNSLSLLYNQQPTLSFFQFARCHDVYHCEICCFSFACTRSRSFV